MKKDKLPEIMYEEPRYEGDPVSQIPFIEVGLDDEMPKTLVVFEYKETGETEVGEKGKEERIMDQIPHMYVDMKTLETIIYSKYPKEQQEEVYDTIRLGLGMKSLREAREKGAALLAKASEKK